MRFDEISHYEKRGKRVWYFNYQTDDMDKPKRVSSTNHKKIKLARTELFRAIQSGDFKQAHKSNVLLRDVIRQYLEAREIDANNERIGKHHFQTLRVYMRRLRPLQNKPVNLIKAIDCQNLLDRFNVSLSTKNHYRVGWASLVKWAMDPDRQLIDKDFMRGVTVAKPVAHEIEIPPIETVRSVIEAADGKWKLIILLLAATGMRAGELRGLTWRGVDLSVSTIRIIQSVKRDGSIGAPKTASGVRTIPISTDLADLLRQHKALAGASRLVFPDEQGQPMSHNALLAGIKKVVKKAGVYWPGRVHVLRHYAASVMISQNWDLKRIQKMMGHADIQTTVNRYGHLIDTRDQKEYGDAMTAGLLSDPASKLRLVVG